jgi:hypothetical protein
MVLDPLRLFRRRRRLREAIDEEVWWLRRRFGADARATALEKLNRPDLTAWGRQVYAGAAKRL